MSIIWQNGEVYRKKAFASEAELEAALAKVGPELFGQGRFYLDVKKRIGTGQKNIPDGYLLDLSGNRPRLFVVEVELASHEPLKHIAVQILQFSLSFENDRYNVKCRGHVSTSAS